MNFRIILLIIAAVSVFSGGYSLYSQRFFLGLAFFGLAQIALVLIVIGQNSRIENGVKSFNDGLKMVDSKLSKASANLEVYTKELADRIINSNDTEQHAKQFLAEEFHSVKNALTKLLAMAEDSRPEPREQTTIAIETPKPLPRSHVASARAYEDAMRSFPNTVMTTEEVGKLLEVAGYKFEFNTHRKKLNRIAADPMSQVKKVTRNKYLYRSYSS